MANASILAAFERMWQHITTALNKKSDKTDVEALQGLVGNTAVSDQITDAIENSKEVFCAQANVTTYAEVKAAIDAGKLCFCKVDDMIIPLYDVSDERIRFVLTTTTLSVRYYALSNADAWTTAYWQLQDSSDRVDSISAESTTDTYPSAKAVYDYAAPVITLNPADTILWDGDLTGRVTSADGFYVKVSDITPAIEDFADGFMIRQQSVFGSMMSSDDLGTDTGALFDSESLIVVIYADGMDIQACKTTFPESGIYFSAIDDVTGLTIVNYTGFLERVLDPDYIPDVLTKVLPSDSFGDTLPDAGIAGRIFFKKVGA